MKKNNITSFNENTTKWYSDLILQSELALYAPVKGTMFFRPYGYAIWTNIQKILDKQFDKLGVQKVSFPLLFPEALLKREVENFKGFAPEVLTVTRVGEKKLNENYVIRPTSETLFGTYFKETLNSYKELPVMLNQWVNVMRWENNTRPFLRNSEFLWQEGHTTNATSKEAQAFAKKIHKIYIKFAYTSLLLPVIEGPKTKSERFAGAEKTHTIETILKDGQALQLGTSHYLGTKFSKAFDVKIQDENNKMYNPFQTSWGVSTRLIGGLVMTHSDDKGLVLPSKIAPYKVVLLTLFADKNAEVSKIAKKMNSKFKSLGVALDISDKGIGFKSQEWEVKGVPIRIEIGPRDIEQKKVTIVIRDIEKKILISIEKIDKKYILNLLKEYDQRLLQKAIKLRDSKKVCITSIKEIKEVVSKGKYAIAYWIDDKETEANIKKETGATIRVLLNSKEINIAINSDKKTKTLALFAKAY